MLTVLRKARSAIRHPGYAIVKAVNGAYAWAANGDQRPAFYDIDKTYPSLRALDQGYPAIRAELESLLQKNVSIPRYHDIAPAETYISGTVDPDKDWKVFMLYTMAGGTSRNQARCPATARLIGKIPNLYQAFFSILDPGKSIPAHSGVYLGYLRYHLGLIVPANNPPKMRVRDEWHTWQEGKSIMFDDSHEHEVVNHSDSKRAVLIVDVLRPMPLPLHAINWTLTQVVYKRSEEAQKFLEQMEKHS